MYRRESTSVSGEKKKNDEHMRARNIILNFRVTADEKNKIERRMALSGLDKQDYLIQSLMRQKVLCLGNVKTFDEMKKQLFLIEEHVKNIKFSDELDSDVLESLRMVLELYEGLNKVTDEDIYVPVRKSKGIKEGSIKFSEKPHEDFYYRMMYEYDRKGGTVDCYSQSLFYLLGLCRDTRDNFSTVFNMDERGIVVEGLYQGWQTGTSRKICQLAFNLWNGFCYELSDDESENFVSKSFSVDEIFCCEYAEYFFEAIRLRYPSYCRFSK